MTDVNELPVQHKNLRLINEKLVDVAKLPPIVGYTEQQSLSLSRACMPLAHVIDDIVSYMSVAMMMTPDHPPNDLTRDESASIRLYTMEWSDGKTSLYTVLNRTLMEENRDKLRPWFKYLTLFLTALVKIPCAPSQVVWCGVAQNISDIFPCGTELVCWSFSSTTRTFNTLSSQLDSNDPANKTLLSIEVFNARNISAHSNNQTEDELLLLPGTYMEVRSQVHATSNLHIIHLRQKMPKKMLLEPPFPGIFRRVDISI